MKRFAILALLTLVGCSDSGSNVNPNSPPQSVPSATSGSGPAQSVPSATNSSGPPQVVETYISEYPSFSAFVVASKQGLIHGDKGELGPIEKKYNVDIVLRNQQYTECIQSYGANGGAVCITNTDIVGVAEKRPSTAVIALSTSLGADAAVVVVDENDKVPDSTAERVKTYLVGKTTYGPDNAVSRYLFDRVTETQGFKPSDFTFKNKDAEPAAQAIQTGSIDRAVLWNPSLLHTLRSKPRGKKIVKAFDSTDIRGEIVDMLVMDTALLGTPGGQNAAKCLAEAFYGVSRNLEDKQKGPETYVALGEALGGLNEQDMRVCREQTKFYSTPEAGIAVFEGEQMPQTLKKINQWTVARNITERPVVASFMKAGAVSQVSSSKSRLIFDPSYMHAVQSQ